MRMFWTTPAVRARSRGFRSAIGVTPGTLAIQ
jgi:hypothetical protein